MRMPLSPDRWIPIPFGTGMKAIIARIRSEVLSLYAKHPLRFNPVSAGRFPEKKNARGKRVFSRSSRLFFYGVFIVGRLGKEGKIFFISCRFHFFHGDEPQSGGVNAVPFSRGLRAVIEHMP